jgi:hypothetical protein
MVIVKLRGPHPLRKLCAKGGHFLPVRFCEALPFLLNSRQYSEHVTARRPSSDPVPVVSDLHAVSRPRFYDRKIFGSVNLSENNISYKGAPESAPLSSVGHFPFGRSCWFHAVETLLSLRPPAS